MTDSPPPQFTFQWDAGNLEKLEKVRASGRFFTVGELESVFDDPEQLVETSYPDERTGEPRYRIIGQSNQNRVISVIFVLRGEKGDEIRIINAWKTKQAPLKRYYEQRG
ncbi:BrnT family toxin [Larkinella insperata]|uniref:BrnT family toxin n=1 Tax=Larkinella insperata TaxID=332158 RepID=A0ABW3QCF7_9BACT